MSSPLLVAKSGTLETLLLPALANRHGLITGATGTGKTVTLQTLAEQFSRIGVPVFMADVKGDLSGMAAAGGAHPKVTERALALGVELRYGPCPVVFWDVFGRRGHPVRATVSDFGPLLLARMLDLNATQEGVLNLVFKIAGDEINLHSYPRFDNPYCRADFDSQTYHIEFDGMEYTLDFTQV
jgi:DNA helicase HerA-like ATPase